MPGFLRSKGLTFRLGKFHKQQHPQFIGRPESSVRRTMRLEPYGVDPVFLQGQEPLLPGLLVHGFMAGFREG